MITFEEFKSNTLKLTETKEYKIKNSYGVYDAYKWIRKNKWLDLPRAVTEKEFYSIIRLVNLKLKDCFMKGYDIKLPNKMGIISRLKYKPKIKLVGDKVVTNLRVDWNKTLELWFNNDECYYNRTLVRIPTKYIHKIIYKSGSARYNNKSLVSFIPCRDFKRSLKEAINNGLDSIEYLGYNKLE